MENKKFDLEDRSFKFAHDIRSLIKIAPKNISNTEDLKQLSRSSGSIAANYIEANECLSKKDFVHRIRICRKEAKESILWLKLLIIDDQKVENERKRLMQEATELMKIMSAIMRKSE